jgi:hypothetical protein
MAHFRFAAVLDPESQLYSLEIYYPAEATTPIRRTPPLYKSEDEAFTDAKEKFVEGFPDKEPPRELKPN